MEHTNDKKWCVYIHTSPNDKKYIGITSMDPPEKRWRNGYGYRKNEHFYSAIKKYGWSNFTHEVVASELNEDEAMYMECELIKKYNTTNNKYGYNLTSGGEIGKTHSEETKRKIADKNSNPSEETSHKMRESARNRCTDEWKQLMSTLVKEQWQNEEYRERQSANRKGRIMTEEWRKNMSESRRGKKRSEEARQNISNGLKGIKKSEESVRKAADAHKKAVVQLRLSGDFIMEFDSASSASKSTSIFATSITDCCKNKRITAGGFKWMYKSDYELLLTTQNYCENEIYDVKELEE